MRKGGVYGIKSFKMQKAANNSFPTSWESAFNLSAIVKDSLSYNDTEAGDDNIEVEDMSTYYATLPSSLASEGFTVQTYDMSAETYNYLMGYKTENGWNVEDPEFTLDNQAVQIITKELSGFPSKTFEWANMTCKVTKAGTIGKSGFPNFNLTFVKQVLLNEAGKEIAGARWKLSDAVGE